MKRSIFVFLAILICACLSGSAVHGQGELRVGPIVSGTMEDGSAETSDPSAPSQTPDAMDMPTAGVSGVPSETPEPTPEPPFRLAWATDTQIMIAHYREMLPGFTAMCQWIADHAEEQNIVAFIHTGDMVDSPANKGQWNTFSTGMETIAAKMPLFVTLGNHDFYDSKLKPVWKDQFFFQSIPKNQRYRDGRASYAELSVGSTDLLLIQLAFREASNLTAIRWLKSVCDAHADMPVIFVVHGYLSNKGVRMTRAALMEKELVSKCPNIRLILCGHSRGIARQTFAYDDDRDGIKERTVHVLMHDLQQDRKRYGYFNILTYDPAANSLSVDSYSPFLDDYIYNDKKPDAERFTIENIF